MTPPADSYRCFRLPAIRPFFRDGRPLLGRRALLLVVVGGLLFRLVDTYALGNVGIVLPDFLLRSAQQGPEDLRRFVARHGVRTVVNLRGACHGMPWYLEQNRVVQELGLSQEDVFLSAGRLPPAQEIRRLVAILDRAEPPILIHCQHGADRTGLAARLALLLLTDASFEETASALGFRYTHIRLGRTARMDDFFDLYVSWLAAEEQSHSRARFRRWLLEVYRGEQHDFAVEEATSLQSLARVDQPLGWRVRLRNPTGGTWHFRPHRLAGVHLGIEVLDEANRLVHLGRAGLLRRDVGPGETIELTAVVPPLDRPGRYRLRLDLIDERHAWFAQVGARAVEEEFVVHE